MDPRYFWDVPVPEQFPEDDIVDISLTREEKVFHHGNHIANNVVAQYDSKNCVVCIELHCASKTLACHLIETGGNVDDKDCMSFSHDYERAFDKLKILLKVDGPMFPTSSKDPDIDILYDTGNRLIAGFIIQDATKRVRSNIKEA